MADQTFSKGQRVQVVSTYETGEVFKMEGDGAERRYWIDRGPTANSHSPGQRTIVQHQDADGAFDAIGPFTAEQLKPWN